MEWQQIGYFLTDMYQLYKESERRETLSGTQFNFFTIFKNEKYENIHSDFIAELLNPEGSHGQGSLFLKLFLSTCIGDQMLNSSDILEKTSVQREYYLGPVNQNDTTGGRIDIRITNKVAGWTLLLENKIYADLQVKQLERYINHITSGEDRVVFLTLTKEDQENHLSNRFNDEIEKGKLICINYQNDIITWLEKCKKEVADNNALREAINQYIYCVNKLTNLMEDKMTEEELIKNILRNNKNIQSFVFMEKSRDELFKKLHQKVIGEVNQRQGNKNVEISYGDIFDNNKDLTEDEFYNGKDGNRRWMGINYKHANMKTYGVAIRLEFDLSYKRNPFVGLYFLINSNEELVEKQKKLLQEVKNKFPSESQKNEHWLYFTSCLGKNIDIAKWIYDPDNINYLTNYEEYENNGFAHDMAEFIEFVIDKCK